MSFMSMLKFPKLDKVRKKWAHATMTRIEEKPFRLIRSINWFASDSSYEQNDRRGSTRFLFSGVFLDFAGLKVSFFDLQ